MEPQEIRIGQHDAPKPEDVGATVYLPGPKIVPGRYQIMSLGPTEARPTLTKTDLLFVKAGTYELDSDGRRLLRVADTEGAPIEPPEELTGGSPEDRERLAESFRSAFAHPKRGQLLGY